MCPLEMLADFMTDDMGFNFDGYRSFWSEAESMGDEELFDMVFRMRMDEYSDAFNAEGNERVQRLDLILCAIMEDMCTGTR